MTRSRLLAASAVAALLIGGMLLRGGDSPKSNATPPVTAPSVVAVPETPPVLVDPEVLEMRAAEREQIEEARESTTTAPSITTTLPPSTTTTAAAPTTSEPSPTSTSPPTTQAPTPTTTTTAAPSGGYDSGAESAFASSINSYRAGNGAAALSRSGSLDSHARSWAKELAQNGSLSHSNIGSLLGEWSSVGENVGVGGSVDAIFELLADSQGHRENMLGDFTHYGIGVYRDSGGTLWTCHVFAR